MTARWPNEGVKQGAAVRQVGLTSVCPFPESCPHPHPHGPLGGMLRLSSRPEVGAPAWELQLDLMAVGWLPVGLGSLGSAGVLSGSSAQ